MNFTSLHWGAYVPEVKGGVLRALTPAPWDRDPSPIGIGLPEAITAPARVRRPAVREGFLRAAERGDAAASPRRRGREAFVELPWDEALDLVAGELRRVRAQHGNEAIYGGSYGWSSAGRFHHAQGQLHRFLNGFGGYVYSKDTYSLGAGRVLLPHIVAGMDTLLAQHTSWDVLAEHCDLFVAFGGLPLRNGQVSPGGASDHQLRGALQRLSQGRTRFVNISPVQGDLGSVPEAEWLPIRPGSDTALMLALAHVLVTEGLHDTGFLARCTVGFERFEPYLLGRSDGTPKTPAWAAERTGLAEERIVTLARQMAAGRTMINAAYALQRARHGEQPFWMVIVLAALLGQIGLPGGGFGLGYGCMNNTGSGRAPFSGPRLPQGTNAVRRFIPVARIADMLLHPGEPFEYDGEHLSYPEIRLVYWAGGNVFHHHQDLNRLVRAWQRPETVIVHEPFWTATAKHADIVLPVTTPLERDDIGSAASDRFMIAMKAAIAPVGEARDDHAILARLADRLGFGDAFSEGREPMQWLRHLYDESRGRAEAHQVTLPAFDAFWAEGLFEVPRPMRPMVLLEGFRTDPSAHALTTPSGRIEIHSDTVAGFAYDDCPGHPAWFEPEASAWPLHLLSSQPATRLHSQYDHGAASRASKVAGREPVTINRRDAEARGISEGEVVRVFNGQGAFLAGARLSDGIAAGVVQIATGAWYDPVDPDPPDSLESTPRPTKYVVRPARGDRKVAEPHFLESTPRPTKYVVRPPRGDRKVAEPHFLESHGNPNVVTPDVGSSRLSQGCAAQSARVEVERWQRALPPIRAHQPPRFVSRESGVGGNSG